MSKVQSVVFDKRYWSIPRAKQWLREHGYMSPKVDIKEHQLRFRQLEPNFKRYYSQHITPTIMFIIGEY